MKPRKKKKYWWLLSSIPLIITPTIIASCTSPKDIETKNQVRLLSEEEILKLPLKERILYEFNPKHLINPDRLIYDYVKKLIDNTNQNELEILNENTIKELKIFINQLKDEKYARLYKTENNKLIRSLDEYYFKRTFKETNEIFKRRIEVLNNQELSLNEKLTQYQSTIDELNYYYSDEYTKELESLIKIINYLELEYFEDDDKNLLNYYKNLIYYESSFFSEITFSEFKENTNRLYHKTKTDPSTMIKKEFHDREKNKKHIPWYVKFRYPWLFWTED